MVRTPTYADHLTIGKPSKFPTNLILLCVCLVSAIWIILYKIFFITMSPIFYRADVWGDLTFTFTSSIVASGIFYFINVHLEQRRLRKIMYPVIKERLMSISVTASNIMLALGNGTGTSIQDEETIARLYGEVALNSKPVLSYSPTANYATWREFFQHMFDSVRFHSDILSSIVRIYHQKSWFYYINSSIVRLKCH